ncbi:MAG: hypothetical protein AB8G15_23195 [Saprospiraceae bacterium]
MKVREDDLQRFDITQISAVIYRLVLLYPLQFKTMKASGIRLENNKSYQAVLSIGGICTILIGGYHLFGFAPPGEDFFPNWLLGLLFLGFGITAWISLLDQMHTTVFEDRIVIKSLFRKRVFLKKDIIGYGLEHYKSRSKQRQRIMIIARGQSCKFLTEQVSDISSVKRFLRDQQVLPNAFRQDNLRYLIVSVVLALAFLVPIALNFYYNDAKPKQEGYGCIRKAGRSNHCL